MDVKAANRWIKLNTNGAAKGNPGMTAAGELI